MIWILNRRDPSPEYLPKVVLNRLENMGLRSNLDHIQTTIPRLITEGSFEVCISGGLTFLGPLSIGVPGKSQLDQGYSMPTMH
jgi:hypothetical protein